MDSRVDHIRRGVEQTAFATVNDLAVFIHANEIGPLDHGESDAEGIHPEGLRVDRILKLASASVTVLWQCMWKVNSLPGA